jgi:hypothetical protein
MTKAKRAYEKVLRAQSDGLLPADLPIGPRSALQLSSVVRRNDQPASMPLDPAILDETSQGMDFSQLSPALTTDPLTPLVPHVVRPLPIHPTVAEPSGPVAWKGTLAISALLRPPDEYRPLKLEDPQYQDVVTCGIITEDEGKEAFAMWVMTCPSLRPGSVR